VAVVEPPPGGDDQRAAASGRHEGIVRVVDTVPRSRIAKPAGGRNVVNLLVLPDEVDEGIGLRCCRGRRQRARGLCRAGPTVRLDHPSVPWLRVSWILVFLRQQPDPCAVSRMESNGPSRRVPLVGQPRECVLVFWVGRL
jgi:hypothetical protein